jgi:hypothetical protein
MASRAPPPPTRDDPGRASVTPAGFAPGASWWRLARWRIQASRGEMTVGIANFRETDCNRLQQRKCVLVRYPGKTGEEPKVRYHAVNTGL